VANVTTHGSSLPRHSTLLAMATPDQELLSIAVSLPCMNSTSSYKVRIASHSRVIDTYKALLYLAHGGLQGTTRPTHYYVVHDEIGFDADTLQTLTNNVSYMFARATKAVSLVSPAYYADLACERGRCYLHSLLNGVTDVKQTSQGDLDETEVFKEAKVLWRDGKGIGENIRKTMFYI
jgi:hypothetical protein